MPLLTVLRAEFRRGGWCRQIPCLLAILSVSAGIVFGDGLGDNDPNNVRRLPKLGVDVSAEQRALLETGLRKLRTAIDAIPQGSTSTKELLPDVEVFHKAVNDALRYQEFFAPQEIENALKLLETGLERAARLSQGSAPWTTATGLVVRGYVSKIDGSVQPYGLVVPPGYSERGAGRYRVDLWFHGRGETLSENNFIRDRMTNVGTFAPADTIVLHPYGRYNNAFKFAGEVDVLEALDSVRTRYRVDDDRISARGFSMGGAAAWQFAVHYSDRWFAANPGAGFSETPEFLRVFQKQTLDPTPFERRLWHWYDCTDWAANLRQCPTVAYSGDQDSQKQAAVIMAEALAKEGITLTHVIGPNTKHAYHPESRLEVDRRMTSLAEMGRNRFPPRIDFVTYTLKYNRMHWLTIDGLDRHWEASRVTAEIKSPASNAIHVTTNNVSALTFDFPSGRSPFSLSDNVLIEIGGSVLIAPNPESDGSWRASLVKLGSAWKFGSPEPLPRKMHNLQGPIDDAFMGPFLFVSPTGKSAHERVGKWVDRERERAIEQWRRHFRGEAPTRDDRDVTEGDIANSNLVLWGDPSSNRLLTRIAGQLPIAWTSTEIEVAGRKFDAANHGLIMIYPNPLNPNRYVVLNSGFTFREFAHLNNARQVAMLPDWAVVDLRVAPNSVWPGDVVTADFFSELWTIVNSRQNR